MAWPSASLMWHMCSRKIYFHQLMGLVYYHLIGLTICCRTPVGNLNANWAKGYIEMQTCKQCVHIYTLSVSSMSPKNRCPININFMYKCRKNLVKVVSMVELESVWFWINVLGHHLSHRSDKSTGRILITLNNRQK